MRSLVSQVVDLDAQRVSTVPFGTSGVAGVSRYVRAPRVRLPHGAVRLVEPDFAGRLNLFSSVSPAKKAS